MATSRLQKRLLSARKNLYDRCLKRLRSEDHKNLTLDFQYIKFDNNNNRKEKDLARVLVAHIVTYCLNEDRIQEARTDPVNFASLDARNLFTKRADSGECGELLLYLLIEVILEAPQVLAKMSLKTNSNMEVHGSDGVHVRYNGPKNTIDVYLGESKMYKKAAAAIDDALASIEDVRKNGIEHELLLATNNFKWLDADAKKKIASLIDPNASNANYRIHFVVLIGFQLAPHAGLKSPQTEAHFLDQYTKRAQKLATLTRSKMIGRTPPPDDIIHIFYVPFTDPAEFRKEFVRCLTQ